MTEGQHRFSASFIVVVWSGPESNLKRSRHNVDRRNQNQSGFKLQKIIRVNLEFSKLEAKLTGSELVP